MEYIIIEVPDKNDSLSRVVLSGTEYQLRFTYNDTKDYWSFGLYDSQGDPIALDIKIVPGIPLNLFFGCKELPDGVFYAKSRLDRIGRDDFTEGNASFLYVPVDLDESGEEA